MNETGIPQVDHNGTTIDLQRSFVISPTPGDAQGPSPSIGVGRVLRDRYQLEEPLGAGGMGTVFKARDRFRSYLEDTEQFVAIKILRETGSARDHRLDLLKREFHCAQMLAHPNIVHVHELDRDAEVDFFTMEFLQGELLSTLLERLRNRPMPRTTAWAIIRDIGAGIAHAHARNVVHADLKPRNIMITGSGEVRILDFGASHHLARPDSRSSVTPAYASCELLAGRSPEPADDIYAFSCIAYELLAGSHPFQRRPSTEARNLGIEARRIPGLTYRQWHTLTMGLSWHRAGRTIPVQALLYRLNAERGAARALPPAQHIHPEPSAARANVSMRAAALCAVVALTTLAGVQFVRLAPGGTAGDTVLPVAAASPAATRSTEAYAGSTAQTDSTRSDVPPGPPPVLDTSKPEPARPKQLDAPFGHPMVAASDYSILPGDHFAEIRVHRSTQQRGNNEFVWWTEAASAKPGVDYVQQGKVTQAFPKGKSSTSFFVKLVPKASRTQREVFYVAIAEAGRGPSSGQVARAAIWLRPNRDAS